MKKEIIFFALIATFLTIISDLSAGGTAEVRKRCFLRYKYKAEASIKSKYQTRTIESKDKSCEPLIVSASDLNCWDKVGSPRCPKGVKSFIGKSIVSINSNGQINHFKEGNPDEFNFGKTKFPDLYTAEEFVNITSSPEDNSIYKSNVSVDIKFKDELSESNNDIAFKSLNATIELPSSNETSRFKYELIIWAANDDIDSTITESKILWKTGFIYMNKEINKYGILNDAIIQNTIFESKNILTIAYNNLQEIKINNPGSIRITSKFHKDEEFHPTLDLNSEQTSQFNGFISELGLNDISIYSPEPGLLKSILKFKESIGAMPHDMKVEVYNNSGHFIKNCLIKNVFLEETNKLVINSDIMDIPRDNYYFIKLDFNNRTLFYRIQL